MFTPFSFGVLTLFSYGVGTLGSRKNSGSHIDASLSRQPLVKGERLVRYEVNAVIHRNDDIISTICNNAQ